MQHISSSDHATWQQTRYSDHTAGGMQQPAADIMLQQVRGIPNAHTLDQAATAELEVVQLQGVGGGHAGC